MYLITGGLGFIGLNFVNYCLKKNKKVIVIDCETYAANKYYKIFKEKKIIYYKKKIGDNLLPILKQHKISTVINFAAETHVDNSIKNPKRFIDSNIIQLIKLFNCSKNYFLKLNNLKKKKFKFIQISTDEVFGSLKKKQSKFKETNKFFPNNPYSATKAAGDMFARAWFKTYDLPIITTNCSNNYGRYQNKEKLIPKIILNSIKGKTIPIYGDGRNTREWIHVNDHCEAILRLIKKGIVGDTYNIGSDYEIENIKLVKLICKILDEIYPKKNNLSYFDQVKFVKDRKAHDLRYSINSNKIKRLTSWKAKINFDKGLRDTIKFYVEQSKR